MTKTFNLLLLLFFVIGIASCDKDELKHEEESGNSLKINLKGIQSTLLNDHLLEIEDASGNLIKSYSDLQNIPSEIQLQGGTYTARISSNLTEPAFDQPLYSGSQNFTITDQQSTTLNLTVSQSNFGIAIVYADDFKVAFSNYSTVVSSADGSLSYSASETRLGYFIQGPVTIAVTYTDGDNQVQTVENTLAANDILISPGSELTIKFEADAGNNYSGYYASASNKTGLELKNTLSDIISTGINERSYDDLWEIYKISDIRQDGTIWDMYSDNPNGAEPYVYSPGDDQCGNYSGEGDCFNREHSVPKSWFNDAAPMYTDMVHLVPTDGYVNNQRSNHPFGEVGSATWTSLNGCKVGTARSGLGYSGTVFEPIDEYKGDFARIYFYFVTRYDDRIAGWDNDVFSTDAYGLEKWVIDMLLQWSNNDPVSEKERNRNDHIEDFQNNRNPYVDHPEFIDMIWGPTESSAQLKNKDLNQAAELIWSVN